MYHILIARRKPLLLLVLVFIFPLSISLVLAVKEDKKYADTHNTSGSGMEED